MYDFMKSYEKSKIFKPWQWFSIALFVVLLLCKFPRQEQGDFSSWLLWVRGDSRTTWDSVRVRGTQAERLNKQGMKKDATIQPKRWRLLFRLCFYFSDLPCMHLDPGVNRLGLNITSVHQTDRRPVTPDIVFPICVILWPQEEDGLKEKTQQNKKRSIHFTNTFARTYTRMHPGSEKPVLVPCLKESLERSQEWLQNSKPNHANERGREQFQQPSSGRDTSGKYRRQTLEDSFGVTLCTLWRQARLFAVITPVCGCWAGFTICPHKMW